MSIFDSIISGAAEKFGLGDKAGNLLAAILGMMTSPAQGGFGGFINRFKNAGLGDLANSWVTDGDNQPISGEQLESALGSETISKIAQDAGVPENETKSAMAYMVPHVVDTLTPNGEIPDTESLMERVGGFLSGFGGKIGGAVLGAVGAAGVMAGSTADKASATAGAAAEAGKKAFGTAGDAAGAVGDRLSGTMNRVGDSTDGDGSSALKWLLPLLLLGLLIVLGYWFCGKSPETPKAVNANANANINKAVNTNINANTTAKTVDSSFTLTAKDGKYTASGVVPDQKTLDEIKAKLTAQFGEGNVDFSGLKVDTTAKAFGTGWWDNFGKILPLLKDWKNGTLAFVGNAITTAEGLPQAAITQIKTLFTGWSLPVSIAGAAGATKQANDEALKELSTAGSLDEVIKALNVSIINFASAKSDIPADAKSILEKASEVLKKQPEGTVVEIGGYTDNKGNADANKKLSQARADSVKQALVKLGVKDSMLKAVGFGDANPIGDNNSEEGRFKNRRIEYKKSDGSSPTAVETKPAATNTNTTK